MNIREMERLISSLPELEGLSALLQNRVKHMTQEFTIEGMQLQASVVKEDSIQTSNISDTTFDSAIHYQEEHKKCLKDINNLQKKINDIKALISSLLPCERFVVEKHVIYKIKQEIVREEYVKKFGDELGIKYISESTMKRFKQKILHELVRRYEIDT